MRINYALFILLTACMLTGCNSRQVELYANKLQELLGDYKAGVLSRIDAERKLYNTLSESFAGEAERDVYESLKIERQRQQRMLTGDLTDGRLAPSQVHEKLRETAMAEFERTHAWFEQELQAQERYQSGLAQVAVDAKKLDALDGALKAVQAKAGQTAQVSLAFGGAFKNEFELQQCKDLERQLGIRTESIASLTEDKPADPAGLAAFNTHCSLKGRKCHSAKPT
ncbi:MAG: hypothetical protein WKF37_21535 [Bryobacteraceae bacterium]